MSYEFKKLSDTEVVSTVGDSASILIEENGVIKRAPKDEVGGGIKVASTAKVGQTIVVKAVDENGNPTEWECADGGIKVASAAKVGQTIVVKALDENGNPTEWQCVNRDCLQKGTVILPETTWTFNEVGIDGIQTVDETVNFTLGEEYVVIWDGIAYNCTCFSLSGNAIGNFSTIGGPSNDEPFGMWSSGNFFAYETGAHTFSIYKNDATNQADWNENDETSMAYIQNRPFYEYEGMNILFEETTIAFNSNGHAECSPQFWVDVGEEYIVTFDGVEYSCIGWKDSDECYNISFTVNGVKITIYDGHNVVSSSALAGNHTLKVEKKVILVQQLDNKFIPYILNSSTSGSTKRFKITVDDNGTLSAVEVTS